MQILHRLGDEDVIVHEVAWPVPGVDTSRFVVVPPPGSGRLVAVDAETGQPASLASWHATRPSELQLTLRLAEQYLKRNGLSGALSRRTLQRMRQALQGGRSVRGLGARLWESSIVAQSDVSPNEVRQANPGSGKSLLRAVASSELDLYLQSGGRLTVPAASQPRFSIIIVTYNSPELCLLAFKSIALFAPPDSETIVVDNSSGRRTRDLLESIDGARVVLNQTNLGFLEGANQGANHARGDVVVLLNSDAQIFPSTLEAIRAEFDAHPQVGVAGGPIHWLDGRLQEAGGVVLSDGSCRGYGRGASPRLGQFGFSRDVDFCSGAFLAVRRNLWEQLGGFASEFAPSYYEDTDLCLRAWDAGWRVRYLRDAAITHFEYGSSTSDDAVQRMTANRGTFIARHHTTLARHADPRLPEHAAGVHHSVGPRVVFVDDRPPVAALGSGAPRTEVIAEALSGSVGQLTIICTDGRGSSDEAVSRFRREHADAELLVVGRDVALRDVPELAASADLVWVSRLHNAAHLLPELAKPGPVTVYDVECLAYERLALRHEVVGDVSDALVQRTRAEEVAALRKADVVVAVSERDAETIRSIADRATDPVVVRHGVPPRRDAPGFAERRGFVFLGHFPDGYSPNLDAVLWFVRNVWPSVRAETSATMTVGGRGSDVALGDYRHELEAAGVDVLGEVAELSAFFDRSRVAVVPTRFASGVPLKAYEAAAHGVPLVVSDLIAMQTGWSDQVEALVASTETADEMVRRCIELHQDPRVWDQIRTGGMRAVERDCDEEVVRAGVLSVLTYVDSEVGRSSSASKGAVSNA